MEEGRLEVDLLAGLRAQYLKGAINLQPGPRASRSEQFAELLVGTRARFRLSKKAIVGTKLDFSGFDIGSGSTLTWNLTFFFDYRLSKRTTLALGYRILGIDYSRGSGLDKLSMNAQFNGPILGASIDF